LAPLPPHACHSHCRNENVVFGARQEIGFHYQTESVAHRDWQKFDAAMMHLPARIDTGRGSRLLHCVIDDLWESGARITLANDTKLSREFVLVLSAEGDARRRCRTLWRDRLQVSVEFLPDSPKGSALDN
jgi:hypothetical protein